ncbi:MAG: hypothetical protein JJ975_07445 [Bacteroidia bacterium]|nr:hypothetical protein [Bacteroidia bacterium]
MTFSKLSLFLLGFMSCTFVTSQEQQETETPDSAQVIPYADYLDSLNHRKTTIDSGDFIGAKHLLFNVFHSEIPSYWIGTRWDFNGTTPTPGDGLIACGYYLTTTMKQTGYEINRYKMAQQASSVLIEAYCSNIAKMTSLEAVSKYLSTQPDSSTFIIGLDSHTGFVTKHGNNYYLIHSNYIGSEGVIREKLEEAQVLVHNSFFMIGSLNGHKQRLTQWMKW